MNVADTHYSEGGDSPSSVASQQAVLHRYTIAAALWYLAYLVLPAPLDAGWYVLGSIATATVCAVRVRRLPAQVRPIAALLLAGGITAILGAVIRGVQGAVTGDSYPFPSVADVFVTMTYILLIAAILLMIRKRVGRLTIDPIIDAGVATIAIGVLQWALVVVPYLSSASPTTGALVLNIIYSVASLMLVAAATLAVVAGGHRSWASRIMAAALMVIVAVDATATLAIAGAVPEWIRSAISPLTMILGTMGLLHPSITLITSRPSDPSHQRRLTRKRMTVLGLALLACPSLLLGLALAGEWERMLLPAAASLALAPLVVLRLGRLVRQNEELASLEALLRDVGEQLVEAETTEQVAAIISGGASRIVGSEYISSRIIFVGSDEYESASPGLHAMVDDLHLAHESSASGLLDTAVRSDVTDGCHLIVGAIWLHGNVSGVLELTTASLPTDDESNAITSLCREASIALRAVEHTEQQVRERSEDRFASLIDNSSDIVAVLDRHLSITYVSPVAQRLLGFPLDYFLDIDAMTLAHPDDAALGERILDQMRAGSREPLELRLRHLAGTFHWFEVVGVDLTDDPNIGGYLLNLREISDRKLAEEQLVLSEARFKALVQHSTDMVVVLDDDGIIRYSSPSVSDVLGPLPDQLLGKSVESAFTASDIDWHSELRAHAGGQHPQLVEFRFRRGDDVRTIETSITDLRSEPAVGGFVLNARDVTERRSMEQRLRYQATHDELTGLANRPHVVEDLDGILSRNSGSTTVAAIAVGLDDFKDVNDSLGHVFGDNLLIAVAERLKGLLSFGDVAARVGGDEFVVVVERSHGENHVTELADQILAAIALPYLIDGRELTITASAGIVFDHDRTNTGEILLRNADTAMYRSKSLGKRQVVVFEPQMHAASYDRLELRADLARAIAGNQFVAHYQPIVDIHTRRITGAEALIRWDHPTRGMLGPNLFIPLAEESGMIGALGEWILRRACTDVAAWRRQFGELIEDFTISVNLSVHQLHDEYIVSTVEEILAYSGLPAQRLVLEVTESTLITDNDRTSTIMSQLRSLGARLAVDDFGTGYSSLGYIQQFEFDILKIDKSFVDGLDVTTNQRIVTAVIDLARQLGVRTVAEGIETEPNVVTLQRLGCDLGQGYLFSRPVSEAAFRELLAEDRQKDRTEESPPEDEVHAKLS